MLNLILMKNKSTKSEAQDACLHLPSLVQNRTNEAQCSQHLDTAAGLIPAHAWRRVQDMSCEGSWGDGDTTSQPESKYFQPEWFWFGIAKVHKVNRNDFDLSFTSWCKFRSKHFYSAAHARFTHKYYPLGSGFSSHCCHGPRQSDIRLHDCTFPVLFRLDEQNQFCSSPILNDRKRHVTSPNA